MPAERAAMRKVREVLRLRHAFVISTVHGSKPFRQRCGSRMLPARSCSSTGRATQYVFDAVSGEERRTHIFVAVLGASNYTYAEARSRDKAKVEVGVLIIERYVLARLRKTRFFSLAELNVAMRELVADLNARVMRKIGVSRVELLETLERPALKGCRTNPISMPNGRSAGSPPTITSRSIITTTRCPRA